MSNNWVHEESELRQRLLEARSVAAGDKEQLVAQITLITDQLSVQQEVLRSVGAEKSDTERMFRDFRSDTESEHRIHVQQVEQLKGEKARVEQLLARATSDAQMVRDQSNKSLLSHREEVAAIRADLDGERTKNSKIGQERAKMFIEVETMARVLERKDLEIEGAAQAEQDAKKEVLDKVDEIGRGRLEVASLERENEKLRGRLEEISRDAESSGSRFDSLQRELQESMLDHHEVVKQRDSARDEVAKLRENEGIILAEREILSTNLLKLEGALIEERSEASKVNDSKVQVLKSDLKALRSERDTLASVLDSERKRNEQTGVQHRQVNSELLDCRTKVERLEIEIRSSAEIQRHLEDEKEELSKVLESERTNSAARQHAVEAAERQVELSLVTRSTLEEQLTEMNDAYASTLAEKRSLEGQVTKWRREAQHAEEVAREAEDTAKLTGRAREEAENSERLTAEVQALRGQLTNLRKKMAESQLDAAGKQPEGMGNGSHVYEAVIARLKQELTEEGSERRALQQRLSEALHQASKAQSLEEEMSLLGRSSQRTQDGLAQTTRLSEKLKEDVMLLQTEKDTAERLMEKSKEAQKALQQQVERLEQQIATERKRSDAMVQECARAERFAADASTMRTKVEGQLIGVAEKNRQFERERSHFMNAESSSQQKISNAQREHAALSEQHADTQRQLSDLRQKYDELMTKNAKLDSTHQALKQHAGRQQEEQCHDITRYRAQLRESEEEVNALQKHVLNMERKCEIVRIETSELAASKAGKQIEELRGELSSTMSQWSDAEATRRQQEDAASKLRTSVHKEKERAALYKAQVSLLEDQLRAASEELEVFRQLDVYKATLQREFTMQRDSNSEQHSQSQWLTVEELGTPTPSDVRSAIDGAIGKFG
jgi:chromosome segregation ATPase